jgi:hypothetical protein
VCLSFAGEDRSYVRLVADVLRKTGIRVFFDEYEEVGLWGKDLYVHLDDVYKNAAHYCVLFVSKYYSDKLWTNHERRSAQERAFKENTEYILPARFDDTAIPGLRDTVGYIDLRGCDPGEFAEMIRAKVGKYTRHDYLPPIPDALYRDLGANTEEEQGDVYAAANEFLNCLKRMSEEERSLVFDFFLHACPAELPDNVHINIDLLRRVAGFVPSKIKRLLAGLSSLGFTISLREDDETEDRIGRLEKLVLEWHDMSLEGYGDATNVANAMIIRATAGYCEEHAIEALNRLDFSQLADATAVDDHHGKRPANKALKRDGAKRRRTP